MAHVEEKADFQHYEGTDKKDFANVADNVAAAYVDPTVQISPDENKRLKRKIYKK